MILEQIGSAVRKAMEGSISGSDSRFSTNYIETSIVPEVRAECIIDSFNGSRTKGGNKLLDRGFWQAITLTKSSSLQNTDANFIYFEIGTTPIYLDDRNIGLYIGNLDSTSNMTQARSLAHLNVLQAKGYRDNGEYYTLPYGTGIRVYGNKALKRIYAEVIAQNPAAVAGFNADTNDYPLPASLMDYFIERCKTRLLLEIQRPASVLDTDNPNT